MDKHWPPRRIVVIGNAGTGKSTLASRIGELLDLEPIHLDRLLWEPRWRIVEEERFGRRHAELIGGKSWLIEGVGYPSTMEARIDAADLVIFTRYSLWRCYWWSLKRELRPRAAAGRPEGCPVRPAAVKLIRAIWRTQLEIVPQVDRLVRDRVPCRHLRLLRSPREVPALLEELRGWRG